jgi:ribonucleoside-diphosphate reductase alpha chain
MIEQIVKRSGAMEPFQASKLNGWGQWAATSLKGRVDWPTVIMDTVATLPEICSSERLQHQLIQTCLDQDSWPYNRMAGRLYASTYHKELFPGGSMPTVKEVQRRIAADGFMMALDYTDEDYAKIEEFIDHERDFKSPHFSLHQIRFKYALRNLVDDVEYETPQYTYMRMAMGLSVDEPVATRIKHVKAWYNHFSKNRINAPTPNYSNLGTANNGYASCCLYTTNDTAASLAVGDHIGYMMTVMSAGIGNNLQCRSIGDAVRGGLIKHQGKLPYYRAMSGAVHANIKNGRAGACTSYYSAFDPEVDTLVRLKNPMTPKDKQIRDMDYGQIGNKFLGRKAALDEQIFLFNVKTAPDLYESFFSDNLDRFIELYNRYEADPKFVKKYVSAREVVLTSLNEAYETGRSYIMNADEVNRHTPFKDPIYSLNLCAEIAEPTRGYDTMMDLYNPGPVGYIKFEDQNGKGWVIPAVDRCDLMDGRVIAAQQLKVGDAISAANGGTIEVVKILKLKYEPEVALCSLAGIVVSNIKDDAQYEDAMYYALKMVDKCIHMSEYVLPHVGYTAKQRLSAGIGMMDLAHHMAKLGLSYSTPEGKAEIHRIAERHSYFAIKCSLRMGRELGNAPWMHRTKWVDGWMPIDTYNRNVDAIAAPNYQYDWEALRSEVVANGGIRHSTLIAYMPGESSSKASSTTNSIYPVRATTLIKTDNAMAVHWAAPDSDRLDYEIAWDVPTRDMIDVYSIFQKFTDQTISADLWRRVEGNAAVTDTEMLSDYFYMLKMGMKSRYYQNTKTSKAQILSVANAETTLTVDAALSHELNEADVVLETGDDDDRGCAGGFCTL